MFFCRILICMNVLVEITISLVVPGCSDLDPLFLYLVFF